MNMAVKWEKYMHVNSINSYYTNKINSKNTSRKQNFTFKSKPNVLNPVIACRSGTA